jgi:hypothetical protein
VGGGREEEHLGAAPLRDDLAGVDLGRVLPEGGALDHGQVPHHQPVQVGQAQALEFAVRRPDRRVLAEQEVPEDLAVDHVHDRAVGAVVAVDPWQVTARCSKAVLASAFHEVLVAAVEAWRGAGFGVPTVHWRPG